VGLSELLDSITSLLSYGFAVGGSYLGMGKKIKREECKTCLEFLPVSEFFKTVTRQCKDCVRKKRAEYRARIGDDVFKARQREYRRTFIAKLQKRREQS
jgi:hypothetical protein